MKKILSIIIVIIFNGYYVNSQAIDRSPLNSHSHNDYLNSRPFWSAYEHRFGSIEVDIHYVDDSLYVAHSINEIKPARTLQNLYLDPILKACEANGGTIYADPKERLILLVDLKTAYKPTLTALIRALDPYRHLLYPKGTVQIIVSGNTPPPHLFSLYPNFIFFDGRPSIAYNAEQLKRVGMISQSFKEYSSWKGEGKLPSSDRERISDVINQIHKLNKPVRFWATPDTLPVWETLLSLKLNYINTDKIEELASFMANDKK